ncbi:MAG TPA: hypothetical protein VKR55_11540 [Bradyrhizobium sp.]|uniref:hypothetical protein n=1 Tax=Bradyrhizobium sp. TaxID=376 RepID=UPI002BD49B3A|nr:hypothetical protein [Bradyrhizobium sp.]HLZ02770.1 hypothetical protein [Bradyrhizobium sp.]
MWKALWKKWTIDKPAMLGDWLWEVFVVQLAALLDQLTLRRTIALIPIVILILAHHGIPLPPELMFAGDLLAYIDIVSVLLLVSVLSRAAILYIIKQVIARITTLASSLMMKTRRLDFRHRRQHGPGRKRLTGRPRNDDDEPAVTSGLAWA